MHPDLTLKGGWVHPYGAALFRGSSRFESLILSQHSTFTCEFNKEEIDNDDDDDDAG